ncbi:MAG: hypothetical protein JW860_05255 [Sedimentisphaerales bacterium]|nr:hypothetical protein [Sedimentisphaerales bacterium]
MGLFLALSGVIGAASSEVQEALADFARVRSGRFELAPGATDDPAIGVITVEGANTSVLYPAGFCEWDDASRHISRQLYKPVFSLHIHDDDLWMYVLFNNGQVAGCFNPVPQYWQELDPREKAVWKGDPEQVAHLVPGLSPDRIANYYVEWNLENTQDVKAYPEDEFTMGDCWQMCDFMNKIGLVFPLADDGAPLGRTFRFFSP